MVKKSIRTIANIKVICIAFAMFYIILFLWASSESVNGRRFERTNVQAALLPPSWWIHSESQENQVITLKKGGEWYSWFGTDQLGRDVLSRCVVGGAISIAVGLVAACIAVFVGTIWGTIAGLRGGTVDAIMMRMVDVLYGLPSIMLVVLITVAANSIVSQNQNISHSTKEIVQVVGLLTAIGMVSWLTVSRVIRGQVRSLKARPSMEACRVTGVGPVRTFTHHLLPPLLATIVVYATLTVPTAILSEAFLSFLGIGIREPLPSWGNLASDGLSQLNPVHSRWWLLLWPCLCIATTLVVMNWVGQRLLRRVDPATMVNS
ncbi:MAG: ABC transporter permease [Phycisphaerales bacterium]|nr:ABC transporter permease [Planctomycetota bacterium]MBL6996935.1 ABC transporter permease [Phycisphaerales bacterium]